MCMWDGGFGAVDGCGGGIAALHAIGVCYGGEVGLVACCGMVDLVLLMDVAGGLQHCMLWECAMEVRWGWWRVAGMGGRAS